MAATATHRCSHCSRDFGRAEHLRRHERTHTNEKPYICDLCPEAYSRRDLLRRHEIKVHDISKGVRQRRKSQNSSESSPRSTNHPRRGSKTAHIAVESPLQPANETEWPQPQQQHMPDQSHQTMWDMPLQPHFEHNEAWTDGQWPNHNQGHQSFDAQPEMDSGQWLNGLYDQNVPGGLGNHTDPSLTLDPALMEPPFNLDMSHIPDLNHGVTPAMNFNTFASPAQSQPTNDNLRVSQEYWNTMQKKTVHLQTSPLPPPDKLSQYINRYVACFHRHQPLFQEQTWSPNTSPVALTLAVCANGALYIMERSNATDLFRMAASMSKPGDEGVWTLQYGMLMVAYAAWSGENGDLDIAFKAQGQLALDLQREWSKQHSMDGGMPMAWESWCNRETLKRSTFCAFTVMNLISIAYDTPAPVELDDAHGLPAHEDQWRAMDAESWHRATELIGHPQWHTVGDVIGCLSDESQPVPTGVGMFGCHVVISSLCQKIILFRKACAASPGLFSQGQPYFSRCLQRWQQMWEQEPESSLTPDHPQGPIPFNSTALLRVACIRLAADYTPVRKSFITGPTFDDISSITSSLPHIDRNDQTSHAALQACLALRVPVQLGFTVIARASFWVWSIQHSLSYFECALFLTQWLQLVQTANDLTLDESHVLNLVRQIVDSSGLDLDRNISLQMMVLQLFIKLLDTGDLTVWGLTPKMARMLQGVSQQFQGG